MHHANPDHYDRERKEQPEAMHPHALRDVPNQPDPDRMPVRDRDRDDSNS